MKRSSNTSRLFEIIGLTLLSAIVTFAHASRADNKDQAKAHFKEGMAAIKGENYPAALTAFEKSYKLAHKAALLFNIAMCEKALYRYVDSITTFRRFLSESGDKIKPELEAQSEQAVQEMMTLIGTLKLMDAPDDAEVFVDGKSIGKTPFKEGVLLDPGQHSIRVEANGFKPMTTDVTVASGAEIPLRAKLAKVTAWIRVECSTEGAAVKLDGEAVGACPFEGEVEPGMHEVVVAGPDMERFDRQVDVKPGDSVTVSVGEGGAKGEGPEIDSGPSGLKIAGIVATALGVGAAGMGVAFNVKGIKDQEKANEAPADSPERAKLNDDIKMDKTMMIVGYAAAGALVVTGVVLLVIDSKKGDESETVAVRPAPGGLAITF